MLIQGILLNLIDILNKLILIVPHNIKIKYETIRTRQTNHSIIHYSVNDFFYS